MLCLLISPIHPDSVEQWKVHGAFFRWSKVTPRILIWNHWIVFFKRYKVFQINVDDRRCVSQIRLPKFALSKVFCCFPRNSMLVRKFFHNVMEAGLAQLGLLDYTTHAWHDEFLLTLWEFVGNHALFENASCFYPAIVENPWILRDCERFIGSPGQSGAPDVGHAICRMGRSLYGARRRWDRDHTMSSRNCLEEQM